MSKIGIFFGSTSGNTEELAEVVAKQFDVASDDIHEVSSADAADMANYDVLLLGSSTWGVGDLQDDWEDFLPEAAKQDLKGKKVAFFGCGDSFGHSDTFCNSLAKIKAGVTDTGCTFIGAISKEGYSYDETDCEEGDNVIGLLTDVDNESDKTEERLERWVKAVKVAL